MKSPRIKLKVCGMRDHSNIAEVEKLSPDYMGFIYYPHSKRFVGEEFAMPDLKEGAKRVGVFVNEHPEKIIYKAKEHRLQFIQLHGEETPDVCDYIKSAELNVIKVFSVSDKFNFSVTVNYQAVSDFFLFDTSGESKGGTGISFDWKLLKNYNQKVPFFLSGGISTQNIGDIKKLLDMNIHAVDVNSKVEIRPGLKNISEVIKLQNGLQKINEYVQSR